MSDTGRALVVYESMYGNTEKIAEAICTGLRESVPTEMVPAYRAPTVVPGDVRLLVVGGPTHAFSMSRASTRQEARNQHVVVMPVETGIREWLGMLSTDTGFASGRRGRQVEVATFDTRIAKVRRLPGSAARSAAKLLRRMGFRLLTGSASFFVEETTGPIREVEVDSARRWGEELGRLLTGSPHAARSGGDER
ncbi:flavodoxin family protein [Kribbella sp. NBC_00889]|uniref:flavodoxin family protein n=1 Tax=Kribbella sp. NBC_00889 TaxID=2975974 RepID=UPI00386358B6|nr:flavodoxin family protein [Kribbella sp. NBC_00889]